MSFTESIKNEISSLLRGKEEAIKTAIVALISGGHLLIEDVPGVGKTTLALALAKATNCSFHRIQFTSDLLPSDILGVNLYNPLERTFEFRKGPVFANIVLADEINRTNPKTQSALLEAMNERKVTIERETYRLPDPFMVIATQNPLESQGAFPLPESQLDRFLIHLRLGYPSYENEKKALMEMKGFEAVEKLTPVITAEQLIEVQKEVRKVHIDESLIEYILNIVTATRNHDGIRLGVSTRGAQFLLSAAKGSAFYSARDYVLPEDIKDMAPLVFGHRILLKAKTDIRGTKKIIKEIAEDIAIPI